MPVNALITCEEAFNIPVKSIKNVLNNADEAYLNRKPNEINQLVTLIKQLIDSKTPEPQKDEKVVKSPQTKRKGQAPEEPEEMCQTNNRAFAHYLRQELEKIGIELLFNLKILLTNFYGFLQKERRMTIKPEP